MGVTVTFIALLELMREGLIEIVQAEPYAPIHVRTAQGKRQLAVVPGSSADADVENEAALAQPELPDENEPYEEEEAVSAEVAAEAPSETETVASSAPSADESADAKPEGDEAPAHEA